MTAQQIYRSEAGRAELMAWYEKGLAHWSIPYRSRQVATRHGRTAVLDCGAEGRPPVVLLHGSASTAVLWAAEANDLAPTHRVLAVDIPGEPGRSDTHRPPWRDHSFAEWLADVLDGLGLRRAAVVGLSQGGWVALRFATVFPERVTHLALLGPGGLVHPRLSFVLKAIALSSLGKRGVRAMVAAVTAPRPLHPEVVAYMEAIHAHFRPRVERLPLLRDEELLRLTMPVLLVAGGRDAFFDARKSCARLERLVPHARIEVLVDEGHALVEQGPRLLEFLTGTATPV